MLPVTSYAHALDPV